MRNNKIPLF